MKKLSFLLGIGGVLCSAFVQKAEAQNTAFGSNINTITTAVPFLSITPDSRSGAMGDAGVALSPDANSIHWNASKLAFATKDHGFSVSYTPWLSRLVPDISLTYLSGYKRIDDRSSFGGSLRFFSLGDITFTDNQGNNLGTFRPSEYALDAAYALKLAERFSVGLTMRYVFSDLTGGRTVNNLDTQAGQSFAVDISGFYQGPKFDIDGKDASWAAGFNISNIGNKISYADFGNEDFIPTNMKLGGAVTMDLDEYNSITLTMDLNKLLVPTQPIYLTDDAGNFLDKDGNSTTDPEDYVVAEGEDPNVGVVQGIFQSFGDAPGGSEEELREVAYSIGAEYWYDKQFAFRAGYFHEHETKGNRKYFTVGAGLKMNIFALDFAYLIPANSGVRSPLENTLRFSLLFDLDSFKTSEE